MRRTVRLSGERLFAILRCMLFAVVRLRNKGRALTRGELDAQPRAVGDLVFVDPPHPRRTQRLLQVAELLGEPIGGIPHALIRSLLNPVVATVTADEMLIFGYELELAERKRFEYVQGWLVRHALPGERRMRRGDVPM